MKLIRFISIGIILIGMLILSGCGGGNPTETVIKNPAAINGTIMGSLPNTRIPKAVITAVGNGKTYSATSGADGRYLLSIPAGTYTVTAAIDSFQAQSATVTVEADANKTQDFTLKVGTGSLSLKGIVNFLGITGPKTMDARSLASRAVIPPKARLTVNDPADFSCYVKITPVETQDTLRSHGITGFHVYRSPNLTGGPLTLIGTGRLEGTNFSPCYDNNPGVGPSGTSQYYFITLFTANGEGPLSDPKQVTFMAPLFLEDPSHTGSIYEFSWQPVSDADAYRAFVIKRDNSDMIPNWWTSDLTWTQAIANGSYRWYVEAFRQSDDNTTEVRSVSYTRFLEVDNPLEG